LQEAALGLQSHQLERRVVSRRRVDPAAQSAKQIRSHGVQQVIAAQLPAGIDRIGEKEPAFGAFDHRHRDGMIELDDRTRRALKQKRIERFDLPPISVAGDARSRM